MSILTSMAKFLSWRNPLAIPKLDTTTYKITTNTHEYVGLIIYQDDFSIKFQSQKSKLVRILKSNINEMSVVSPNEAHQVNSQSSRPYKSQLRHQRTS